MRTANFCGNDEIFLLFLVFLPVGIILMTEENGFGI